MSNPNHPGVKWMDGLAHEDAFTKEQYERFKRRQEVRPNKELQRRCEAASRAWDH